MDLRTFLQDLQAVKSHISSSAVKEFIQHLESKTAAVTSPDLQQYLIACVFQQLQLDGALGKLGSQFTTKHQPRFPAQYSISLDQLKQLYDATESILVVAAHPRIESLREAMKDHVLQSKTLPDGDWDQTWNATVQEQGMVNLSRMRSVEKRGGGLVPVTKQFLEVMNAIISDNTTKYRYDSDPEVRSTQRVRAIQAIHAKLVTDFVATSSQTFTEVNVVEDNYYKSVQSKILAAGSQEELIKRLPDIVVDICNRIYMGLGPDVPFDKTFWTWLQKKNIVQQAKAFFRTHAVPGSHYDQLVTSFDFQEIFRIRLIAK